jgi:peroxiredoxin Q/BCP
VNPGSQLKHAKFRSHHSFPFPLLVDEGRRVARLYRSSGLMVKRTVYLIGPDGTIRYGERGNPSPADVLKAAG